MTYKELINQIHNKEKELSSLEEFIFENKLNREEEIDDNTKKLVNEVLEIEMESEE